MPAPFRMVNHDRPYGDSFLTASAPGRRLLAVALRRCPLSSVPTVITSRRGSCRGRRGCRRGRRVGRPRRRFRPLRRRPADGLEDDALAGSVSTRILPSNVRVPVRRSMVSFEVARVRQDLAAERVAERSVGVNVLHASDRRSRLVVEGRRRALDVELAVNGEARARQEVRYRPVQGRGRRGRCGRAGRHRCAERKDGERERDRESTHGCFLSGREAPGG